MKNLRDATKEILRRVEEQTGNRIELMPDAKLGEASTLRPARKGTSYHLLRYAPTGEPLDYVIAYQAGFLLRLFGLPTTCPPEFTETGVGEEKVLALLTVGQSLGEQDLKLLPDFAKICAQWALRSLRSTAIGLHVESWIAREYPGLADLQQRGIARQQQQNLDVLLFQKGKLTIPTPFLAMPAAYALFADKLPGGGAYAIPYEALGATGAGQDLLDIYKKTPTTPIYDKVLVDYWAEYLGMSDWYKWTASSNR